MAALAAAITLLILLNIITRANHVALFWVDELAIYAMVWMALVGASAMVRERAGIAANLVVNGLGEAAGRVCRRAVDGLIFGFSISLILLCWRWYDLPGLIAAGFDLQRFSAQTFNFIYEEPTTTLGIPKYLVWLVVPLISVTFTLHSTANLLENYKSTGANEGDIT